MAISDSLSHVWQQPDAAKAAISFEQLPGVSPGRAFSAENWRRVSEARSASPTQTGHIAVLFGLVWLTIDGTGLGGVYPIYQGHLFFQKATYETC